MNYTLFYKKKNGLFAIIKSNIPTIQLLILFSVWSFLLYVSSNGYTSNLGDFGSFKLRPTDDEQRILSSVGYK